MHILPSPIGRDGRIRTVVFSGLLLITLLAQSFTALAQRAAPMPAEDNELYVGVLRMISTLHNNPPANSGVTAAAMDEALQRDMGITSRDYQVLLVEAETQDSTIWNGAGRGKPVQGDIRANQVFATKQRLAKSMTPDGWSHFHDFVNGRYREMTSRMQVSLPGGSQ